MRKGLLATLLTVAFTFTATAQAATCGANTCTGQINSLYVNANGNVYIALVGGLSGLSGCTPVSGAQQYVTLLPTSTNFNQVYATMLAAEVASRSVAFDFTPGSTNCSIIYVIT
jgi:hypothetical protein